MKRINQVREIDKGHSESTASVLLPWKLQPSTYTGSNDTVG